MYSAFYCIVCTLLIVAMIILFAVIGISAIVYYAQHPKEPTFTLQHASVQGFNLTSSGHFTSFFDIIIKANNPNRKMKLDYSGVRVLIIKDKQILAEDTLDDFAQRKGNVTVLRAEPIALNVSLNKGPLFNLGLEIGMGYIMFDVYLKSFLNNRNLQVSCENVVFNLTTSGNNNNNNNNNTSGNTSIDVQQKFSSIDCGVYIYSDD